MCDEKDEPVLSWTGYYPSLYQIDKEKFGKGAKNCIFQDLDTQVLGVGQFLTAVTFKMDP